jgi:hypothetical protein
VLAVPIASVSAGDCSFTVALISASGVSFGAQLTAAVTIAASAPASLTLTWSAPTENTDGSALTDLAGYYIYFGNSPTAMTQQVSLDSVGSLSYVFTDLSSGTWYFEVIAVNSAGVQSAASEPVAATI